MGFFTELKLVLQKNMGIILKTVWSIGEGYHLWMLFLWVASELSSSCVCPCSYSPALILRGIQSGLGPVFLVVFFPSHIVHKDGLV